MPHDIVQGSVGDCYMVAVAAALAEYPNRIKKIVMQNTYNKEGIFTFNLWVKGKPQVISIDDRLAFSGSQPIFAKKSSDGAWWMALLEKAYAKVGTNYEVIGFGWMSESARILTGAPSYRFSSRKYSAETLYTQMKDAD